MRKRPRCTRWPSQAASASKEATPPQTATIAGLYYLKRGTPPPAPCHFQSECCHKMQATLGSGTVCARRGIIGRRKFRSTSFGRTPQDPSTLPPPLCRPFSVSFPLLNRCRRQTRRHQPGRSHRSPNRRRKKHLADASATAHHQTRHPLIPLGGAFERPVVALRQRP